MPSQAAMLVCCRRNLLLACKRLLCVYMSERALWRKVAWSFPRLTIAGEQQGVDEAAAEEEQPQPRPFAEQDRYLTSKLVLLQRVAGRQPAGWLVSAAARLRKPGCLPTMLHAMAPASTVDRLPDMHRQHPPAGMVEVLEIDASPLLLYQDDASGDSEWRAEEYLAVLQPGMLRGLGIQCTPAMPGSLVRAVGRFTGLTGLRMITEQPAPAATSAVLRRLPLLQRLQLQAAQMAAGTVPALLALQQLTWLQLEGPSAAGETFLSLQQLSSLCGLSLQNACPRGVELDIVRHYTAPAPAAFPAGLASYNFGEDYDFIQVSCSGCLGTRNTRQPRPK